MTTGQGLGMWCFVWAVLIAQATREYPLGTTTNSTKPSFSLSPGHSQRIHSTCARGCAQQVNALQTPISPVHPVSRCRSNRARSDTTRHLYYADISTRLQIPTPNHRWELTLAFG